MRKSWARIVGIAMIAGFACLASCRGTLDLRDAREREIVSRGQKPPLPDDPEGKRSDYQPKDKPQTKFGRFVQKYWARLPNLKYISAEEEERRKPKPVPPPADPR